ncbi:MAG TPA: twin-arginine translocation signal domain-containing protein, partial [Anaerolineae bacterium]|nr:twin-arginine translocation signal domain-containing protein [Anaerolineae bacterium]
MNEISRREFIRVSALATAGVAVAACAKATEEPVVVPTATSAPAKEAATATPMPVEAEAKEAPMLADMVTAGTIPPLDERLPSNPAVFFTNDGIGKHGGTMRRGFKGVSDRWGPTKLNDRALVWFDNKLNQVPRLAESWEVSDDATT